MSAYIIRVVVLIESYYTTEEEIILNIEYYCVRLRRVDKESKIVN